MKKLVCLFLLSISGLVCSQTKVIAHKSHSGSKSTFTKVYQNKLFDSSGSNFGLPGNKTLYKLDSVIALNDSVTVLKISKSKVCYQYGTRCEELKPSDFEKITDTVTNHAIFNKKNSVSFIKKQTHYNYKFYFSNALEEVTFVGFRKK